MMFKRGEFKITSMLFGILLAFGLFFTLISSIIGSLCGLYDTSSYVEDDFSDYSHLGTLNQTLTERGEQVENNKSFNINLFDPFADLFRSILEPFQFIYNSYKTLFTATNRAVIDLQLYEVFGTWVQAVLITLVVVGIVMFRVYLKVKS
jgi:hypothetical protein